MFGKVDTEQNSGAIVLLRDVGGKPASGGQPVAVILMRGALRDIGCKYLAKAGCGAAHEQMTEVSLAQIRRTGANAFWRQPWTVD